MSEPPLGFDFNDGGISNQKMALLGLVIEAARLCRPLYLPRIYNRDQSEAASTVLPFDEVFHLPDFTCFLARWGIDIVPPAHVAYEDRLARGGWPFFEAGATHLAHLHREPGIARDIAADCMKSLVPRITRSAVARHMRDEIFAGARIGTVLQLRIERDWRDFCRDMLESYVGEPEDYWLDAPTIGGKVRNTFGAGLRVAYAACDERHLLVPASEIKREVEHRTGLTLIFKSDLSCAAEIDGLTPLESSLLDFDIGRRARIFVGLSRSSFSNLLAFQRHIEGGPAAANSFIYNLVGPVLGRRTDRGTQIVPRIVCE